MILYYRMRRDNENDIDTLSNARRIKKHSPAMLQRTIFLRKNSILDIKERTKRTKGKKKKEKKKRKSLVI
jgi:hypothetical protein